MSLIRLCLALCLLPPALASAAADDTPTSATAEVVRPGDMLAVAFTILPAPSDVPYAVEPGDEVYLNFRWSAELSQLYTMDEDVDKVNVLSRPYVVQPDGTLVLTALDKPLPVRGLTAAQIGEKVAALYKAAGLLSQPDLNVSVTPRYARYEAFRKTVQSESERPVLYVPVPEDGRIALPLLADVSVTGLGARQVGEALTARYRERGLPLLTVSAWFHELSDAHRSVRVLGEVRNPGVYPLRGGGGDLWGAIAQAGGFGGGADTARVRVIGPGGKGSGTYGFEAFAESGDPEQNPRLSGDEVVIVPKRK